MTPEQFAYWLQGYSEIDGDAPTAEQWQVIRDHLALVFDKVTPERGFMGGRLGLPIVTTAADRFDYSRTHTVC